MTRGHRIAAAVAVASALLGACTSLDNLSGGPGSDAGSTSADAATNVAAEGGADADATDNLVDNPGFELGNGGCGATWIVRYGQTTLDSTPHTGAHSCRLCSVSPASELPSKWIDVPIEAGAGFHAEVWFASPPDGETLEQMHIYLEMRLPDGGTVGSPAAPPYPYAKSSPAWQIASLDWRAPEDGTALQLNLVGWRGGDGGNTNGCILWDDAVLVPSL